MVYCLLEINKQTKNNGMEIRNSADYYDGSGLRDLILELDLHKFFEDKDYGNNEVKFFYVINCLKFNAKSRRRFDHKEKVLFWDVVLDYLTIKKANVNEKKKILATSIISSFDILDNYKKLNLDKDSIKKDAKEYFIKLGWL